MQQNLYLSAPNIKLVDHCDVAVCREITSSFVECAVLQIFVLSDDLTVAYKCK
jgi:hypothetical protein